MIIDERFQKLIKVILHNEGGYVNDPDDAGGETNYGITKKQYPSLDIKTLTAEQASEIYYTDYYLPLHLDHILNDELCLQVFDMGVNSGIKRAVILLQQTLKLLLTDGLLGPQTIEAIKHYPLDIVEDYKQARIEFYTEISKHGNNSKFLEGWIYRVEHTKL